MRTYISSLALVAVLLPLASCRKHRAQETVPRDAIRISGVNEPPELLIPAEKPPVRTEETDALGKVLSNLKAGNEAAMLPAFDAYLAKYPGVGDLYPAKAAIRCMTGDLQGANADVEKALSGARLILSDNPQAERPEMLAVHAKLAFLANKDSVVEQDLHSIIELYSSDINYLTDGRVKVSDKPNSACGWTIEDIDRWLQHSHNSTDSQVFREIYVAAFAPLDDAAKVLTQQFSTELINKNPGSAPAWFYAGVGAQKIVAFKAIGFSNEQRAAHSSHIIDLYSKAIQLNPRIEKAFAERADAYLQQKNYSAAISDYDHAIALVPTDAGLWNDRGLAKQETYDKDGAIADYTQAIKLKTTADDFHALTYSLDNRGDLYTKLGDYKRAFNDYTSLIGYRLHDLIMSINLDFFRALYPEYASVDDAKLKDKLHRMYYPNFSDETFEQVIAQPQGMHPSFSSFLPEAYLKRADVLLALKNFAAAHADYMRSQLFAHNGNEDRWRTPAGLKELAIDVQTLDTHDMANIRVWVKLNDKDNQTTDVTATQFVLDCNRRTVQVVGDHTGFEPAPGSPAEIVRDFFCSSPR